ncbi:RecF/RecN/SMC N terminal domain containing protein [Nitzschia inconspicua]|uniref:RecF/RecN/SMC N terminal domain containing protein n=1 Tax=Nitzschia inconspicua TaxID=303405 RepID=A0A9K3KQ35_9STRA|nr:RecF/RecN/SMC N terminal domain containing protein [Nitzschia inconspicua]
MSEVSSPYADVVASSLPSQAVDDDVNEDDLMDDEEDAMEEVLTGNSQEFDEDKASSSRVNSKRVSPPLDNADDDDEEETRESPVKKRRGNNDDEQEENEYVLEKENNGSRQASRKKNKKNRNRTESPDINSALSGGHRNVNVAGKPPEAGVILKIYVENFMCHRKLSVDLCPNVNFIYGQNGSGKSAILAAIQICLGAGARRTNRARNLKELVRKDSNTSCAKIRVTLLNKGDDAYEHEKYGDSITVERTISLKGGFNGFKLFDEEMKEKSRSRKDLDEMLDKLNIQVENPVAILDQEEAKKFLTGKAADKYKFFMKATELERIDVSYRNAVEQVAEMEQQALRLTESLVADKELLDEAKKEVKKHEEIGKLEVKKSKLEAQYAWSIYKENLAELNERRDKLGLFEAKAAKRREELLQAEAASQEGENGDNERRDRLDALIKEAEESSDLKKKLEQDLKRAVEPQKQYKRQKIELEKEKKNAERALLVANKTLQQKRNEIAAKAGSAEAEQARRNEVLRKAEEILVECKSAHNELKQNVTDSFRDYENLEPQVQDARKSVSQVEHRMEAIKSRIHDMKSSSANSLDVFGQRCSKVKKMVDDFVSRGKFSGPVLGPIGSYCKIHSGKEEFAKVAESAMGPNILDRFVVFNDGDRKTLQSIRQKAGCGADCGIFQQSQHPRYRIPDPPEMDGIETIASVISVQNDLVFNCLVDNAKIDERALARSKEQSERQLLGRDNSGRHFMQGNKLKEVFFLPKGDNWKLTKGGNIQMISNTRRMNQSIGVDMAGAVREAEMELQSMKQEHNNLNRQYSKLEHDHLEQKKLWNKWKRAMQENEKKMDDAQQTIDDVKAEETNTADMDVDTNEEEQEVAEAQEDLDRINENIEKVQEAIAEKEPDIVDVKAQLEEVTERNKKVLADLQDAENSLTQYHEELARQHDRIEKKRQKLEQYNQIIEEHSKQIFAAEVEVEKHLMVAKKLTYIHQVVDQRRKERDASDDNCESLQTSLCVMEPTDEDLEGIDVPGDLQQMQSPDYYKARVERAEDRIQEEKERRLNSSRDDYATALDKYVRAKEIFAAKREQIKEIHTSSSSMRSDMDVRKARWRQFRDFISDYSGIKFDETLNIKGSSGTIEFDHANGSLDLIVQKDSANENSQQKDVKALSGGERSFTTIALLLALGEMLETPFRVMDEFDVFLDPVTRKLIIDTLIQVGQSMAHRQFIFITPQDVSNVESSSTLKILKMRPPERREVAGGHTQQTLDFSQIE